MTSVLKVDSIQNTSGTVITGIVGAEVKQITASNTRSSATSYADDLDFGSYTPKLTTSTVLIQGVANFDSVNNNYCYYKWVVNGSDFLSTGSTPLATHIFYSATSLNNLGHVPSTIITSVNNTDGSAISVKCQGKVQSGTLSINRSNNASQGGSPSSVMFLELAP